MEDARALATVELLGALTYAQLRSFEVTARAVRSAPGVREAETVAGFAAAEHTSYRLLRDHLEELTDLAVAVMERQRARIDDYFDRAPVDRWVDACTFFAVGLPLAADFTRQIAPALDPATAEVLVRALADRGPFERFALERLAAALADADEAEHARLRRLVADVTGRALTGFQAAITDSDALEVLLGDSADRVREVAIKVLEGHRRRMHALGLDDLE